MNTVELNEKILKWVHQSTMARLLYFFRVSVLMWIHLNVPLILVFELDSIWDIFDYESSLYNYIVYFNIIRLLYSKTLQQILKHSIVITIFITIFITVLRIFTTSSVLTRHYTHHHMNPTYNPTYNIITYDPTYDFTYKL